MTAPRYGFEFQRSSYEARPVIPYDMSTIGFVLPSDDADASITLNTPFAMESSDPTMLAKLGTGPLYKAVTAINDQLDEFQVSARVVFVRVAEGVDIKATIANIIGDQGQGTGIYALLRAGQILGFVPRLLGFPGGYTGYFERENGSTGVVSAAKAGGNTGNGTLALAGPAYGGSVKAGVYQVRCVGGARGAASAAKAGGNTGTGTVGSLTADATSPTGAWRVICQVAAVNGGTFAVLRPDGAFDGVAVVGSAYNSANGINFTIADGGTDFIVGDEFVVTVTTTVPANGGVFSVKDPDGNALADATVGVAYTGAHVRFTINDGATDFIVGDGFNLTVTVTGGQALANPLCAELQAVCNRMLAHAVVGGPGLTVQDAIDWRETINADRLIPVDCWYKVDVGVNEEVEDGVARILGIAASVDYQHKGIPSHSWMNRAVQGIKGLARYDSFSWTDGATQGQILAANNIGFTSRGEAGLESAVADSGFVFLGTDNAGNDELWRFYSVTRMRDYVHLALIRAWRRHLGVNNITRKGVDAVLTEARNFIDSLIPDEHLIGGRVEFEASKNTPDNIRLGKIRVALKFEEPSPLIKIDADSLRYREALDVLIDDIAAQAQTAVGFRT